MDDETAEIELLDQHLNKTRQISQRMTSILSKFDSRLIKLDKSILPLHKSTQSLTRIAENIEKTLASIDRLVSDQDGVAAEEALILKGPQPERLHIYIEALERLAASIAFKPSAPSSLDTARLIETGGKKLAKLFTTLTTEASTGAAVTGADLAPPPFPDHLFDTLGPLVITLRSLPLPATHPSHPAAPGIQTVLSEAQRGYAATRGKWITRCLEVPARRVIDRSETIPGPVAGGELGQWVRAMLLSLQLEYDIISQLAPLPNSVPQTFASLLNPVVVLFSNTVNNLVTTIKRALQKHTFLALSAYGELASCQGQWDNIMRGAARKENELKDALQTLRSTMLRSFPEFLVDIKTSAMDAGDVGSGTAPITTTTINYLNQIPPVHDAMSAALSSLGDGNWRMGEGMSKTGRSTGLVEDDSGILENYIHDIIAALLATLTTLSKSQRRPAIGSVFLLNNIVTLRNSLILVPTTTIDDLIAQRTQDALNSSFRTAKAGYFDANYSPLITALAEDARDRGGISKSSAKDKWTRFFEVLDEIADRQRTAKTIPDDPNARQSLGEEVVRLAIPAMQRFLQKNREKDLVKGIQKYIKMMPEEVESQIRSWYQ
ncbi:Cullin repeat-like-containing domain protein [Auriculariales sp. MPI-PUGE-AT-0066]|nr:Cullin repeat-like-containing domain protein [Auriculariales sp. MPI-PUGE-AT-0066]